MRYSHLASTFSSLDMAEEACLTLVLAIVYDIVASVVATQTELDDEPIHLFRKLSTLTNEVVLMHTTPESRGSRRSLVSRLVCLSEPLSQKAWTLPACSRGEDFILLTLRLLRTSAGLPSELITEPSVDSFKPSRFSLATLLSFAFKDNKLLRNVKKTRMNAVRKEQLLTMADVVAEHGALLQRDASVDQRDCSSARVHVKDFNTSFQFLEWLAKSLYQDDEDLSHTSIALVHILAAVSMVPSTAAGWSEVCKKRTDTQLQSSSPKQSKDNVLRSQSLTLLSKTTEQLRGALDRIRNEEQRLASSALLACSALYSSEISGASPAVISTAAKSEILSSGQEAVQLLVERRSISNETRDSFRMCLTRTLTRFQDMVNLEGDKLTAAQAALLIARIHDGAGNEDERWYWAMACNLLQDGGLHPIAKVLVGRNPQQSHVITLSKAIHLKDLMQLEMVATQSRMKMLSLEADASESATLDVQGLFDQCNTVLVSQEMEPFTRVVLRWVCTSCVMALADGFECRGAPNRAVENLRQGVNLCRESISALRKIRNFSALVYNGDDSTAWADTALSTFLLRLAERRITGQQRISTAYARLGDHRRSEAYAVGAAKECMLGGHDMTRQRLKINELASIDRSEIHAMCQSASYRLLLEMKARASPSDHVIESLHNNVAFDGILTATQVGNAADKVAWQIDNIRNLLNGKSIDNATRGS